MKNKLKKIVIITFIILAMCQFVSTQAMASIAINKIEPTVFFQKQKADQHLKQLVYITISNDTKQGDFLLQVNNSNTSSFSQKLESVPFGESKIEIYLPEPDGATALNFQLLSPEKKVLANKTIDWQPQKKWKIFHVSYAHHDLGYGNYPHRLRTEIRHGNIERLLQYCSETDDWDNDSKFRYVIETSEPITSFVGSHSLEEVQELARRIKEGRIQIGGINNTVSSEQLSYELMARLFYLTNRHSVDLLGIPKSNTVMNNDVIGLTWPLASYTKEADIPYFFHGHNNTGFCMQPACYDQVFYWQGPGGIANNKVLMKSTSYGGYDGDILGDASLDQIQMLIRKYGENNPTNSLFIQEGVDFKLVEMGNNMKIHEWNKKWEYPRLISSTLDMYFDDVSSQLDSASIKTYAKDANNEWADQDSNDAWLIGKARRAGEWIPTVEKFSTIAHVLANGAYPWTEIYQSYHRLIHYHEHSNGIDFISPDPERLRQYETEQVEHREMVTEPEEFINKAADQTFNNLANIVTTTSEKNIMVSNPMARSRTDVVSFNSTGFSEKFIIKDSESGKVIPHQIMPDGNAIFIATDIPATGYKMYGVVKNTNVVKMNVSNDNNVLESKYYKITFNEKRGTIISILDKELNIELVDKDAPHQFNEYLFERFETDDIREPSKWYKSGTAQLQVSNGNVANTMSVKLQGEGARNIAQTVTIYHDIKKIDFGLDMEKLPSRRTCFKGNGSVMNRESAYISLPFKVSDFSFHHEVPGGVVEPIHDQFDGSCTAFYAARHFSDVSNKNFGITVSSPDVALVEYGYPRSCPLLGGKEDAFEQIMEYPKNSNMYLYLLNNMFSVNVRWDQQGSLSFKWSVRSHEGDWKIGKADHFGWDVHNPLIAKVIEGKRKGELPLTKSFMAIDKANVICSTIKPAEHNGNGFILRFNETQGKQTTAKVSLPFINKITSAVETNLVEDNRSIQIPVQNKNELTIQINPFGVKTIRILSEQQTTSGISSVQASAISDMQIKLSWTTNNNIEEINHYNIYRGEQSNFEPGLINLVGQSSTAQFTDQPKLNFGGWINYTLEPATTYYYRVEAVDRFNNKGEISKLTKAKTLDSNEQNMIPLKVEALHAMQVSSVSSNTFVNLLFRTNCESDIDHYEIHRSTNPNFNPDNTTQIGIVSEDEIIKGSIDYGHVPIDYKMGDYDHMMYQDNDVKTYTKYYYRVCAVDNKEQKGTFSKESGIDVKINLLDISGERIFLNHTTVKIEPEVSHGLKIRYSIDGTIPTINSNLYTNEITLDKSAQLVAALFIGNDKYPKAITREDFYRTKESFPTYMQPYSARWSALGNITLIDGLSGEKWPTGFQGFEGNDMDILFEFREIKEFSEVSMRVAQMLKSWVYFPVSVNCFYSVDGKNYKLGGEIKLGDEDKNVMEKTKDITVEFEQKIQAKYIRVVAKSVGKFSEEHAHAGSKVWIFTDEITFK